MIGFSKNLFLDRDLSECDGHGNDISLGTDYELFNAYAAGGIDLSDRDRLVVRGEINRQNDADLSGFTDPFTRAENDFRNTDRLSFTYTRPPCHTHL